MVKNYSFKTRSFLVIILSILFLDLISKFLIQTFKPNLKIFPFFSIIFVKNFGAGFGILQFQRTFLTIIAIIVLSVIMYYYKNLKEKQTIIATALITAGTLGNTIDRIFHGFVIDFLDFFIATHHWPTFNIADCALVIGIILILFNKK